MRTLRARVGALSSRPVWISTRVRRKGKEDALQSGWYRGIIKFRPGMNVIHSGFFYAQARIKKIFSARMEKNDFLVPHLAHQSAAFDEKECTVWNF